MSNLFPKVDPLPSGIVDVPSKKEFVKSEFTGKKMTAEEAYKDCKAQIDKIDGRLAGCSTDREYTELMRIRQTLVDQYAKLSGLFKEVEVAPVTPAVFVVVMPSGEQVSTTRDALPVKTEIIQ